MTDHAAAPGRSKIAKAVLLAVPILFWIAQEIHPFGPPPPAHRGLALLFMMAFCWMTETLPIHWVALLPLVLAPFFLSAFTANAAASQLMMTLVTGIVDPRSVHPGRAIPYLYGVTVAASCDFMLPCGTPPNAIVFGTRYVRIRTMAATGAFLDLVAALLAATWIWFGARHFMTF